MSDNQVNNAFSKLQRYEATADGMKESPDGWWVMAAHVEAAMVSNNTPSPRSHVGAIKPIEWEDCDDMGWCADTLIGRYWVETDAKAASSYQVRFITMRYEREHEEIIASGRMDVASARKDADADYEARIRAALASAEVADAD